MPGKCSFQDIWLDKAEFKMWLRRDKDKHRAYCILCKKGFELEKLGIGAIYCTGDFVEDL